MREEGPPHSGSHTSVFPVVLCTFLVHCASVNWSIVHERSSLTVVLGTGKVHESANTLLLLLGRVTQGV